MSKTVPVITNDKIELLLDKKFLRLYDYKYEPGRHYFVVSRNTPERLAAVKSEEAFKSSLPDAVSCFVIVILPGNDARLLLTKEYRYPAGRFLLSIPAGLIDEKDRSDPQPLLTAARREIFEETGLVVKPSDRIFSVNDYCLSSPGMTDESNALICAVSEAEDDSFLTDKGSEGTELFAGFELVTREQAEKYLSTGRDEAGVFYSMYTYAALLYFLSDRWKA